VAVRLARPDQVAALPAIEDAAETLFATAGVALPPAGDGSEAARVRHLAAACADGRVLVAVDERDRPIGVACLELVDGEVHLDEMDVHPDHGRRGHGTALVEAVCAWARARGLPAVTLTTFRDVPWNGPFYRRLGFVEVPDAELGPGLAAVRDAQTRRGLDRDSRCAMRRPV
jgi:GNAT superfamily N-acetyltransferase